MFVTQYVPEPGAPPDGEWVRDRGSPIWRQAHPALVTRALRSWKGDPAEMRLHLRDEMEGDPLPGNGSGKMMRAQAGALLWEVRNNPRTTTKPLYRGSHVEPVGPQSWSESKKVAELWASKNKGRVFVLPKGSRGLRVLDYTTSAFDAEKEWVVWL